MSADLLAALDAERRCAGTDSGRGGVVREFSADGSECRIVFSRLAADEVDDVIRAETSLADVGGYTLEWKLYGHDVPAGLDERLLAAGFAAEDREQVLVLPVNDATLATFSTRGQDIRRIHEPADLADYAEIAREIGRVNPQEERQ